MQRPELGDKVDSGIGLRSTLARVPHGKCVGVDPGVDLRRGYSQRRLRYSVERLYCKRPILCLASSKILTPPPPSLPGECLCIPPLLGEDTLAGWREGGGSIFWKTPDTALYSTYVSTLCGIGSHTPWFSLDSTSGLTLQFTNLISKSNKYF
jgi:hypothetical protein